MRNTLRRELAVCGHEAVLALASSRPDAIRRLFFSEARAKEFGPLCSRLAAAKRPYNIVDAEQLERLSGTPHHQGVVAMIDDVPPPRVDEATLADWAAAGARIVVLDRVGDDHNLGAIARSAAFFGWTAIVIGLDDGAARLSTSAYRVARGALERIRVFADDTAAAFVKRAAPYLAAVGADHRATLRLRDAFGAIEKASSARLGAGASERRGGLALVLGNEESGLSPEVRAACSLLARIDGAGTVESLNVSQAAAIMLYELSGAPAAKPGRSSAPERNARQGRGAGSGPGPSAESSRGDRASQVGARRQAPRPGQPRRPPSR